MFQQNERIGFGSERFSDAFYQCTFFNMNINITAYSEHQTSAWLFNPHVEFSLTVYCYIQETKSHIHHQFNP